MGIKNKEKLGSALLSIEQMGISVYPFFEPLFNNELTAFSTEPLDADQQSKLRKFQLIKQSHYCEVDNNYEEKTKEGSDKK